MKISNQGRNRNIEANTLTPNKTSKTQIQLNQVNKGGQSLAEFSLSIDNTIDETNMPNQQSHLQLKKVLANRNIDSLETYNTTQATKSGIYRTKQDASLLNENSLLFEQSRDMISGIYKSSSANKNSSNKLQNQVLMAPKSTTNINIIQNESQLSMATISQGAKSVTQKTNRLKRNEFLLVKNQTSKLKQQTIIPLTEEEQKKLERKIKQDNYLKQLELLTSDLCPKRHPFDLRPVELLEIKQSFPEFKKSASILQKYSSKSNKKGMDIQKLREVLQQTLKLKLEKDNDLLDELINKLDRKNQNNITWDEFLRYLDHEGLRREMVNDAQLYGMGVKRLKEIQRVSLKEPKDQETYINTCLLMNYSTNFSFILTLDEKNRAKIYDAKTFNFIQELQYPSNYAEPKVLTKPRPSLNPYMEVNQLFDIQNLPDQNDQLLQDSRTGSLLSGKNQKTEKFNSKNIKDMLINKLDLIKTGGSVLSQMDSVDTEGLGSQTGPQSHLLNTINIKIEKSSSLTKKESVNASFLRSQSISTNKSTQPPAKKVTPQVNNLKIMKENSYQKNNLNVPEVISKNKNRTIIAKSQANKANKTTRNLETILEEGVKLKVDQSVGEKLFSRPRSRDVTNLISLDGTPSVGMQQQYQTIYNQDIAHNLKEGPLIKFQTIEQGQKRSRSYLMNTYGRRKLTTNKSKFEVLGLQKEEENNQFGVNSEVNDYKKRLKGYDIKFLMPNIQDQAKKDKEIFDEKMKKVQNIIDKGNQKLKGQDQAEEKSKKFPGARRNQQVTSANNSVLETSSQDSYQKFANPPDDYSSPKRQLSIHKKNQQSKKTINLSTEEEKKEKMMKQMSQILQKRGIVNHRLGQLRTKIEKQDQKLKDLSETNKYFYRQTSSTPYQVAQAQYMKLQMEKNGIDTLNSIQVAQELIRLGQRADSKTIRDITGQMPDSIEESRNYCNPEMIAKYVEKLKMQKTHKEISKQSENDAINLKKKNLKNFKSVYALCATYNQELGILAISLIDREIKMYRFKQNGAKCLFVDLVSFTSKYYVTCMYIERAVQNSKPILCMGSKSGEIEIYYIDDLTPKGEPKIKAHDCSPFNFFFPKASLNQRQNGKVQNQKQSQSPRKQQIHQADYNNFNTQVSQESLSFLPRKHQDIGMIHSSSFEIIPNRLNQTNSIAQLQQSYASNLENNVNPHMFDGPIMEKETNQEGGSSIDERSSIEGDPNNQLLADQSIDLQAQSFNNLQNHHNNFEKSRLLNTDSLDQFQPIYNQQGFQVIQGKRPKINRNCNHNDHAESESWQGLRFDPFDFSQPEAAKKLKQKTQRLSEVALMRQQNGGTSLNTKQKEKSKDEITQIRYVRDIGLIVSSFNGTLKFFDAFSFQEYWCTNNQSRQNEENSDGEDASMHDHFTTFDVNPKLGLLVTGGVEGRMVLIDPYALGIVKNKQGHQAQILSLYIYAEQQQIISIASDRTIGLWDSRLRKLEMIKDADSRVIQASKFSSSTFDHKTGNLYIGCHQINVWKAQIDQKIEINALQIQTLSKNILEERKMLDWQDPSYDKKDQLLKTKDVDAKTGRVLVTSASQLVDILLSKGLSKKQSNFNIITIDSENLLRVWDLQTSNTTQSYRCPIDGRVTAIDIDKTSKYLAVGSSKGDVVVINMQSGGVIYQLTSHQDKKHPNAKKEITILKFNQIENEYWLFGGQWGGNVLLWSKPRQDNNFTVTIRIKEDHKSDLLSMATSETLIATGDDQGTVGIWNIFSGQLKFLIDLPTPEFVQKEKKKIQTKKKGQNFCPEIDDGNDKFSLNFSSNIEDESFLNETTVLSDQPIYKESKIKNSVVQLEFHPFYVNFVQVLLENGHIHLIEAMNGSIFLEDIAIVHQNSSWACDAENYEILVVGDNGQAALFDISLGCQDLLRRKTETKFKRFESSGEISKFQKDQEDISNLSKLHLASPQKYTLDHQKKLKTQWKNKKILTNKAFFLAHEIKQIGSTYVVTIKFVNHTYISGTSDGIVKLWRSRTCELLGVLNSSDWDPRAWIKEKEQE